MSRRRTISESDHRQANLFSLACVATLLSLYGVTIAAMHVIVTLGWCA